MREGQKNVKHTPQFPPGVGGETLDPPPSAPLVPGPVCLWAHPLSMPRAGRATAAPPPAAGGAIKTTGPAAAPATAFHVAEKASVAFLFSIW